MTLDEFSLFFKQSDLKFDGQESNANKLLGIVQVKHLKLLIPNIRMVTVKRYYNVYCNPLCLCVSYYKNVASPPRCSRTILPRPSWFLNFLKSKYVYCVSNINIIIFYTFFLILNNFFLKTSTFLFTPSKITHACKLHDVTHIAGPVKWINLFHGDIKYAPCIWGVMQLHIHKHIFLISSINSPRHLRETNTAFSCTPFETPLNMLHPNVQLRWYQTRGLLSQKFSKFL